MPKNSHNERKEKKNEEIRLQQSKRKPKISIKKQNLMRYILDEKQKNWNNVGAT